MLLCFVIITSIRARRVQARFYKLFKDLRSDVEEARIAGPQKHPGTCQAASASFVRAHACFSFAERV